MTKENNELKTGLISQDININEKLVVFEHVKNYFITVSSRYEAQEKSKVFTKLFT